MWEPREKRCAVAFLEKIVGCYSALFYTPSVFPRYLSTYCRTYKTVFFLFFFAKPNMKVRTHSSNWASHFLFFYVAVMKSASSGNMRHRTRRERVSFPWKESTPVFRQSRINKWRNKFPPKCDWRRNPISLSLPWPLPHRSVLTKPSHTITASSSSSFLSEQQQLNNTSLLKSCRITPKTGVWEKMKKLLIRCEWSFSVPQNPIGASGKQYLIGRRLEKVFGFCGSLTLFRRRRLYRQNVDYTGNTRTYLVSVFSPIQTGSQRRCDDNTSVLQ